MAWKIYEWGYFHKAIETASDNTKRFAVLNNTNI